MKHWSERTIPEKTEKVVTHVTCDLCGRKGRASHSNSCDWEPGSYVAVETTSIMCERGYQAPLDGKVTTTLNFDLCPECFVEKLVPWFESQGAKPAKRDSLDDEN